MSGGPGMRDGENEAFIVDRYLESLLARGPADATDLAPELHDAATALAAGLPRYHPSFRFEEALAARLAGIAAGDSPAVGELITFPGPPIAAAASDVRSATFRPGIIGGVLTSAAISIAGAAYVAWRRTRPPSDPMARAIRAAARRRTA